MKNFIIALVVLIVLVAGAFAIFHKSNKPASSSSSNTPSSSSSSMNMPRSSTSSNSNSSTPTATNAVSIKDFSFSPDSIKVAKGTKVTWTNNDSTAHTVTADSGSGPNSDTINPGDSYSFTFNTAGTFMYHCSIHSSMQGTVVVE